MEPLSQENPAHHYVDLGADLGICVNLKRGDQKYVHYAEGKIRV